MLTNVEYAAYNKVPVELSPQMDEFAAFTVLVPSKVGFVDLWAVKKAKKSNVKRINNICNEAQRQINLAKYIVRGWAFDKKSRDNPNATIEKK